MSRHAGISASSVQRIWSKNDLKPHRVKPFKLSNDPKFEEKFWDVIGLYLDPPIESQDTSRPDSCSQIEMSAYGALAFIQAA